MTQHGGACENFSNFDSGREWSAAEILANLREVERDLEELSDPRHTLVVHPDDSALECGAVVWLSPRIPLRARWHRVRLDLDVSRGAAYSFENLDLDCYPITTVELGTRDVRDRS